MLVEETSLLRFGLGKRISPDLITVGAIRGIIDANHDQG